MRVLAGLDYEVGVAPADQSIRLQIGSSERTRKGEKKASMGWRAGANGREGGWLREKRTVAELVC